MDKQTLKRRSPETKRRNTAIGFVLGLMLGGLVDAITGDVGLWTILGMVLGSLLGYTGLEHINWMEYPKGVLARLIAAWILFFATFFGTYYALSQETFRSLQSILPFAPLLPGFLFLYATGYALSRLDELQSRIQIEAIAIGFGITAMIGLTYGMLGLTGVHQPNWMLVPVIMVFSWLAGKLWTRWKYR